MREPQQTLAANLAAERGLACAQHDDVGIEAQHADVVETEKAVARRAVLVDAGQREARERRIARIDEAVRSEVHESIEAEIGVQYRVAARSDAGEHEAVVRRDEGG